ncbi:hypothetical protein [Paenibacillus sp. USDA918EY]|uniref:hypothetical protein n=1 Tax=Paenibacillus sp. USDA918EY TaxID=2689575 RepID=UPI00135B96A4|nr:hypothetical protein [Paenibacillus sp. USDA918EY]
MEEELVKAGIELGSSIAKSSVQSIMAKIKTAKASGDKDKTISNLEEIINELISDRNRLVQLAQSYEEELITQRISDKDIDYITMNIIPLIESLAEQNVGDDAQKTKEAINLFKPILSKELFNIAQLLGFNFKQAIGEPLTKLVNSAIQSKMPIPDGLNATLQLTVMQRDVEFFKIMQDEEAYQRYLIATGKAE